jgi:hypothetical protein
MIWGMHNNTPFNGILNYNIEKKIDVVDTWFTK